MAAYAVTSCRFERLTVKAPGFAGGYLLGRREEERETTTEVLDRGHLVSHAVDVQKVHGGEAVTLVGGGGQSAL